MIYSLCSSSFCQGVKVVVVEKDTHFFFFFFLVRDFLLPGFLQSAVLPALTLAVGEDNMHK